jgi:hypothetical protein
MGDLAAHLGRVYSVTVTLLALGVRVECGDRRPAMTSHRFRTVSAAPTNGTPLFRGSGNDMHTPSSPCAS